MKIQNGNGNFKAVECGTRTLHRTSALCPGIIGDQKGRLKNVDIAFELFAPAKFRPAYLSFPPSAGQIFGRQKNNKISPPATRKYRNVDRWKISFKMGTAEWPIFF